MSNIIRPLASWPLHKASSCIWAYNAGAHNEIIILASVVPAGETTSDDESQKKISKQPSVVRWLEDVSKSLELSICLAIIYL